MLEEYVIDKDINKRIENYFKLNKANELWQFGNNILYKMCQSNFEHTKQEIIAGKLWIIGRSYAAALERRKKYNNISSEDFFTNYVIPKMLTNAHTIDTFIDKAKKYNYTMKDNIDKILYIHKFLTDLFYELTGLNKRSLASKYLHFHCPDLFFIYDSRAHSNLVQFVKKKKKYNIEQPEILYDTIYEDFYYRALKLLNYVQTQYNKEITPRDIDNILVFTKD